MVIMMMFFNNCTHLLFLAGSPSACTPLRNHAHLDRCPKHFRVVAAAISAAFSCWPKACIAVPALPVYRNVNVGSQGQPGSLVQQVRESVWYPGCSSAVKHAVPFRINLLTLVISSAIVQLLPTVSKMASASICLSASHSYSASSTACTTIGMNRSLPQSSAH